MVSCSHRRVVERVRRELRATHVETYGRELSSGVTYIESYYTYIYIYIYIYIHIYIYICITPRAASDSDRVSAVANSCLGRLAAAIVIMIIVIVILNVLIIIMILNLLIVIVIVVLNAARVALLLCVYITLWFDLLLYYIISYYIISYYIISYYIICEKAFQQVASWSTQVRAEQRVYGTWPRHSHFQKSSIWKMSRPGPWELRALKGRVWLRIMHVLWDFEPWLWNFAVRSRETWEYVCFR